MTTLSILMLIGLAIMSVGPARMLGGIWKDPELALFVVGLVVVLVASVLFALVRRGVL